MNTKKAIIKESEYLILLWMAVIAVCVAACGYVFTRLGLTDYNTEIVSVIIIGIFSLAVVILVARCKLTSFQRWIVLVGYLIRLAVMWIDIYVDRIGILHSGDDARGFFNVAMELRQYGQARLASPYSKFISYVLTCFGNNRMIPQYLNILCFVGTMLLVARMGRICETSHRRVALALLFLAFMPNYVCLSSILLRESSMIFFNTLAVFLFINWLRANSLWNIMGAIISVMFAIILHSASIGVLIAFVLVALLWDGRQKRLHVTYRTGIILMLVVGMTILFTSVSIFRDAFLLYFPSDLSIQSITGKWFEPGGSDYLTDIVVRDKADFIFWTLVRMVYFVFSPMPMDWRGLQDMGAFAIDSLPIAMAIISLALQLSKSKNKLAVWSGLLACLITIGIFAWGVTNAGTAMRHRGLLIGVFALSYVMACGKKSIITKEVESEERE